MKRIRFSVLTFSFLLLASLLSPAQSTPTVRSEMLVSTQWLSEHLKDPKVVVIHISMERQDYDTGHIPGARYLSYGDFVEKANGLRSELPNPDKLKETFEKLGISDDSQVILYSPHWYPVVARGYFTLDYLGHKSTALLNGSLQQWMAEKRPVSTEESFAPSRGSITPQPDPNIRAMLAEVKTISDSKEDRTVLLDSRPQKRYNDGHISGAVLVFWEETVVDPDRPLFHSPEQLLALFKSRGILPGQKIVTYCEIGEQASHNYFVAKYLGFDDKMYDGSYQEWAGIEKQPVVKGPSRR
jgi:thiosulfate/3-mercaptopyruvate sulfurtransferase